MHFILEPHIGAISQNLSLEFGMKRDRVRSFFQLPPSIKPVEPENDFYESEGLILGYNSDDKLEYIEIIKPSTAEFKKINFFVISLSDCLDKMKNLGFTASFEDGGYNFESIGLAFYCPHDILESVSLYQEGYYEDL